MIVPEPKFYLKNPSATEPTLISMQAKYEGQRVFMSTGNKILPSEWDFQAQRAKVSRKNLSNGNINTWLDKMAVEFKLVFRNYMIDGVFPEEKMVSRKILENLNLVSKPKVEVQKPVTLFPFIDQFIEERKVDKKIATIKSYKGTFNHLKEYSKLFAREFDFNDLTIEWRAGFIKYLQSLGLGRNTENKHIKNIKVFMNAATERKLNTNLEFRIKSFNMPVEEVDKIFLTMEEVQKLFNLELEIGSMWCTVRDYFIISCMTSLRYSDFINIRKEHIKDDTIQMVTKKTGEKVIIPISPMVKAILEKYNYSLPPAPCNQVFNRELKKVGRLAEINEMVSITKTISGVRKEKTYYKYQLLTCHTGRRSLISNSILAGLPTNQVMLISGHRSFRVFQSYVRISQKQNAEALGKHTFFN